MVSLNSRTGLRRALEPGHGSLSEAHSFPQFSFSQTPNIAAHTMKRTKIEFALEEACQDKTGRVSADNALA
jgi:hypothetical protein